MKKGILLLLIVLAAAGECGTSSAEIMKADIPDVELTPNLNSVLSLKNSIMPQRETMTAVNTASGAGETAGVLAGVTTNGYILPNSSIVVDSLTEPKCIFYGNYNAGSGDAFQYLDINTITFECQ
ncbi:hypothetical protein [Candidatus Electronema sp. JM]|uniref:hypothetical protein n=1 Tax=Candidatus Electronema sp. JM TaxID=3401571 RepID=UPI003AA7BD8F